MNKKTIIIGNHPLVKNLVQQYEERNIVVVQRQELSTDGFVLDDFDELCFLANKGEDNKVIAMLAEWAMTYNIEKHHGKKLICHLLIQDNETLQMLQICDFCEAIRQKMDVYPFTMDEVWSRSITLDYEPITIQSEKHIHLVVFGMDEIAKMVAIQAAHVAHYPNYVRNHSLRTRITMIDEQAEQKCEGFIKRYQHLFDNSYYRIVKPSEEKAVVKFHKPMYEKQREDFVDVEWEFVESESWNVEIREKLRLWCQDERQVLTVVIADKDGNKNLAEALHLPNELFKAQIPIYLYSQQEINVTDCPNIHGFGMIHRGYDVTLPIVKMAKNVNYIYDWCYVEYYSPSTMQGAKYRIKYAVEIDHVARERSWAELSNVKRMSNQYNAMTIATKMRSIGLKETDWEKFYDIPQQDIELLAEVEHNRWSVEELILGFRPCTEDEQIQIEADIQLKPIMKGRKIHYDLRAYNDLRPDETGKSVKVYDHCLCSCLPLIAKTYSDEKGGVS